MGAQIQRYFIVIAGVAAALWLGGLILFAARIHLLVEPVISDSLEPTDAIVVLTGGSERVEAGVELLKAGKGKKLLISGVHHGSTLDQLLANQSVPKALHDSAIILGHEAETTIGNADETQTWMKQEGYHSLRLVTANYHMPRSLLLFRAAMPDITIIPYPVLPDKVKLDRWWHHSGTASLLVTEYNKYLLADFRLWLETP